MAIDHDPVKAMLSDQPFPDPDREAPERREVESR
jgi:hypothetical protein